MSQIIQLHDLSGPGLDVYARLTEARLRAQEGVFIAESVTVIEHALDAGYEPVSFLMEERHAEGKAKTLIDRCPDVPVYTADRSLLAHLTGYELTRGVLCAMKRKPLPDAFSICAPASRVCVLESITDSTNVGAIFRSAAALGATPCCCRPTAAIRSADARCACRWGRCSRCRGAMPRNGRERSNGFTGWDLPSPPSRSMTVRSASTIRVCALVKSWRSSSVRRGPDFGRRRSRPATMSS